MTDLKRVGCIPFMQTRIKNCYNWLPGWNYRIPINLLGGSSGSQTDYQLKVSLSYLEGMQGNFADVRFTEKDGETPIDAWLESKVDDLSATVWADFPTTPANGVNQTYYMYYGNPGVADNWDGSATFPFFDDFTGDLSKWDTVGTPTIVSEKAELADNDKMMGKTKFGYGYAFEAYSEANEQDIGLVGAYDTIADLDNGFRFTNSDSPSPDVLDEYKIYLTENGAVTTNYVYSWDDFQNTLRRYSILRPAADDVSFMQGAHSVRYTSGYIPTVDLGLMLFVWDSSQESTLKVDWGFVRKYAANPPTYTLGDKESY